MQRLAKLDEVSRVSAAVVHNGRDELVVSLFALCALSGRRRCRRCSRSGNTNCTAAATDEIVEEKRLERQRRGHIGLVGVIVAADLALFGWLPDVANRQRLVDIV